MISARCRLGTAFSRESDQIRLNGAKILVPIAQSLDFLLVTARDERGKLCVIRVPAAAKEMSIRQFRAADGHVMGDVRFEDVLQKRGPRHLLGCWPHVHPRSRRMKHEIWWPFLLVE